MKRPNAALSGLFFLSIIANVALFMQLGSTKGQLDRLMQIAHHDVEERADLCRQLLEESQDLAAQHTLWSYDHLAEVRDGAEETCRQRVAEHMRRGQARGELLRNQMSALATLIPGPDAVQCCDAQAKELAHQKGIALGARQKLDDEEAARKATGTTE